MPRASNGSPGASDGDFSDGGLSVDGAGDEGTPSGLPHWAQNFALDLLEDPHAEHWARSDAEHSSQYLAPSGLFEPQLAQRIACSPLKPPGRRLPSNGK